MHSSIVGIEYFLPDTTLTTQDLSTRFPKWRVEKIDAKTGIHTRHIAADHECASDLAVMAAKKIFDSGICRREDIDFLLFCTQSPDYVLPSTACLLQDRLGIRKSAGAFDFNLGCSGFVYGLGIAEGLISSGQASSILLITADTICKYIDKTDKSLRLIFGDGAAATLIRAEDGESPCVGPFIYGTDGNGAENLIVPNSGSRRSPAGEKPDPQSVAQEKKYMVMDGNQLFNFAVDTVPASVTALLDKAKITIEDVQLFVFHQANAYMLEELRKILNIPREKFQITISHCANTVSSTIPIALKHAMLENRLRNGDRSMLVGFGVGYCWAATIVQWKGLAA